MIEETYKMTELGYSLKEYRIRNNITQQELANLIGVSTNTIHLWGQRCAGLPWGRSLFCQYSS